MDSRGSIAAVVMLAACTGSSTLTEDDVEKALREQVPTTKSVKVEKITKMDRRKAHLDPATSRGCNPMFDGSTYAVHVTYVADMGECPRGKTLRSMCGENKWVDVNLCFRQNEGKWVYSFGEIIIPHGEPPNR